ncbi:TIGR00366 family protein [Helicobacter muridarum]|uniref:Short-chain fatty acid transport protein, scFAT family membrane protein n=1 Tax=Helicobacter muridarum TaxID=216 RepID=A0A099TY95_9HELI|nr:TIGR00366 family protein [Helicobacter muridarum]TLE01615.1 TIGR00366 family protein [Helicobacter muridarum]STQ86230.1 Short-chain fatty acid transport protein, scFAT family; membrane protein [Helicobacter muridarum]
MFLLRRFTHACVVLASRCLPDSFVIVAILTIFVFFIAMFSTQQSALDMMNHWGNGAWSLLGFSMQMALVLVLGQALASAKVISKFLKYLASIPKSYFSAIIMVAILSMVANWINWGFGLVISAIFAKEIAKSVKGIDYRLLIATAYSGFVVWHGGLSGSIPLTLANGGETLSKTTSGVITEAIPVSMTIFSSYNLIICAVILVCLPALLAFIHPSKQDIIEIDKKLLDEKEEVEVISHKNDHTLAEYLDRHFLISLLIGGFGFIYIISYFAKGGVLNLNIINMIFLFVGILLHRTPISYIRAINKATKSAAGILLQFPFYAGIMGMMMGVSSNGESFAGLLSSMFASIATKETFPLLTFISAGIVNIFVPSGGGQWAVQAPIMMPAGLSLGVDPSVVAMAIAWGDAWTNMIQPFWALPALAIAGLGAKDIMGYCVVTLIFVAIVVCVGFLFLK